MTTTLVFHTITSRSWDFSKPHDDQSQPPLLALVASLWDDMTPLDQMTRIVTLDDGERISEDAFQRDGISEDMVANFGMPIYGVIDDFMALLDRTQYVAAYSVDHHLFVVNRAMLACDRTMPIRSPYDLMRKSTIPCKLPTRTAGVYKMPKLIEAYKHFSGQDLKIPHGGDVFEVLGYHLMVRETIYLGLKQLEADELAKAASPLTPTW